VRCALPNCPAQFVLELFFFQPHFLCCFFVLNIL
jgi:hypothetical protein